MGAVLGTSPAPRRPDLPDQVTVDRIFVAIVESNFPSDAPVPRRTPPSAAVTVLRDRGGRDWQSGATGTVARRPSPACVSRARLRRERSPPGRRGVPNWSTTPGGEPVQAVVHRSHVPVVRRPGREPGRATPWKVCTCRRWRSTSRSHRFPVTTAPCIRPACATPSRRSTGSTARSTRSTTWMFTTRPCLAPVRCASSSRCTGFHPTGELVPRPSVIAPSACGPVAPSLSRPPSPSRTLRSASPSATDLRFALDNPSFTSHRVQERICSRYEVR
ncbi:hypothetical protein Psed_6348 [Pseudonocardia dioxanivorans CB1190]|uniref:Uncharacterized protein n=1 Tax=Pseudonocardia dioxanivorans (strain ATCC 55486 / DSM 44775 / JCM 13855 / CB1190) TaxID=675635 RepID=F4CS02_PSEUX|nr:hypothetical protein Psed_6348 [Pseudonocardia dioxanivorans CB1190]